MTRFRLFIITILPFLFLTLPACTNHSNDDISMWNQEITKASPGATQSTTKASTTKPTDAVVRSADPEPEEPEPVYPDYDDPDPEAYADPGCPEVPENGPYGQSVTVYVSRNGIYHRISNCSGMIHFSTMTQAEAIQKGCRWCKNCWDSPPQ